MESEKVTEKIPLEFTIDAMDKANVRKGMICAWWGPQGRLISNEEVAEAVNRYPDRFVGIASVNLYKNQWKQSGRSGSLSVNMALKDCELSSGTGTFRPQIDGIIPCLPNVSTLISPSVSRWVIRVRCVLPNPAGRIPHIDEIAIDFPELKVVCGHVGYPWTNRNDRCCDKHKNVFIDTSAYTAKRFPPELVAFMKENGKKKVLFGSNYPMLFPAKCMEKLEDLQLEEDGTELFLFRNAERIFGL
ncbi:MAG: amidohydrolase family protein [Desulfobacterales bacterium]